VGVAEFRTFRNSNFGFVSEFDIRISNLSNERYMMNQREIKKLDTRIKAIKNAAQELKRLSGGIQAVDRNADRILASVKMLEINISDLLDLRF
jgi:hypothetical protein